MFGVYCHWFTFFSDLVASIPPRLHHSQSRAISTKINTPIDCWRPRAQHMHQIKIPSSTNYTIQGISLLDICMQFYTIHRDQQSSLFWVIVTRFEKFRHPCLPMASPHGLSRLSSFGSNYNGSPLPWLHHIVSKHLSQGKSSLYYSCVYGGQKPLVKVDKTVAPKACQPSSPQSLKFGIGWVLRM